MVFNTNNEGADYEKEMETREPGTLLFKNDINPIKSAHIRWDDKLYLVDAVTVREGTERLYRNGNKVEKRFRYGNGIVFLCTYKGQREIIYITPPQKASSHYSWQEVG